jgi:hypothetical protein
MSIERLAPLSTPRRVLIFLWATNSYKAVRFSVVSRPTAGRSTHPEVLRALRQNRL